MRHGRMPPPEHNLLPTRGISHTSKGSIIDTRGLEPDLLWVYIGVDLVHLEFKVVTIVKTQGQDFLLQHQAH